MANCFPQDCFQCTIRFTTLSNRTTHRTDRPTNNTIHTVGNPKRIIRKSSHYIITAAFSVLTRVVQRADAYNMMYTLLLHSTYYYYYIVHLCLLKRYYIQYYALSRSDKIRRLQRASVTFEKLECAVELHIITCFEEIYNSYKIMLLLL